MSGNGENQSKLQVVILILLVVAALVLAGAIGWVLVNRNNPQPPTPSTEPSSEVSEPETEQTQDTRPSMETAPDYGDETEETEDDGDFEDEPTVPAGSTGTAKPASIFSAEHANLYTGVRFTAGGSGSRNSITVAVVDGKGAQGTKAIAYILSATSNSKNDSNEMFLTHDVLSGVGFCNVAVNAQDDILWFWVDSQLSADQLLHVNVNSKNLAANAPVYTVSGGKITKVAYQADHTKVTTMGPVPYTMNSADQTYARIKICKGWSGWIGIPVSSLSIPNGDSIDSVTMRLYGQADSLCFGDVLYLDELQLTGANMTPTVTSGSKTYSTAEYVQNPSLFTPVWKGKWSVPAGMLDFEEKYRQFFDPKGRVLSVAHRGDRNGYYPENSLEGCLSSILAGADIIEVDIAKTKDGHLVVMHDETITATTNIAQLRAQGLANDLPTSDYVKDWTLEQLQRLRLTDDRKSVIVTNCSIPTLRDMIKVCKDRVFITLDKADRFDWYADIWPLLQELNAYRTVMVPYNYTTKSGYGYDKVQKILSEIKDACGYDAIYMADARSSGSLPYVTSELEKRDIPKALRISEYDASKYIDFLPYVGTYRIYAETIKTGVDVALWTEMADKGYNIIMGWGDIYSLTRFIAQRHFS